MVRDFFLPMESETATPSHALIRRHFGRERPVAGPFPLGIGAIPAHRSKPTKPSLGGPTPEKILQAFNTWAFKREQPDNAERLHALIARQIEERAPLSFVLYWGKGPRDHAGVAEATCLDYLASLGKRAAASHPYGVKIKLIFTDTHATLNGHDQSRIDTYFASVEAAASKRGFSQCRLSDLVREWSRTNTLDDVPATEETIQRLRVCAEKWFRGEGTAQDGAARYYQMNMVEKRAVETAFPKATFITFNGSEYRELFPARMPIFYMYSLRRGVSVKPWFMNEPETTEPEMTGGL